MSDPATSTLAAVGTAGFFLVIAIVVRVVRGGKPSESGAQRERDRAHREAQRRDPAEAATKGERYELVVKETNYDRVPPEVRGTINGLQTFVGEIPDPEGGDALEVGETIAVQVTDYGTKGTTAEARFLERA